MSTVGSYVMVWDQGQRCDTYQGGPVPFVAVLQEMRGVRGVRIERTDGRVVIDNAGSQFITHLPSGRRFVRKS